MIKLLLAFLFILISTPLQGDLNSFDTGVEIKGGTDGTTIGNTGDSLKTIATIDTNTPLTVDSNSPLDVNNYWLEVVTGMVANTAGENKFGHNSSVATSSYEDIWHGSISRTWLSTAQKILIVSADADDTNSAGTGARSLRLFGQDVNWVDQQEDVLLNGGTNVITVNEYLRAERAYILTAGSSGFNEGDIEFTAQTTGDKLIDLPAEFNQSQIAAFSCPAAIDCYLIDWTWSMKSAKETDIILEVRDFGSVFRTVRRFHIDESGSDSWFPYFHVSPKSDVRVRAKAGTGNHEVSAAINILKVAQ